MTPEASEDMISKIEQLKSLLLRERDSQKILKGIYGVIDYVEQEHGKYPELFLTKRGISMRNTINLLKDLFESNGYEEWVIPNTQGVKDYLKGNLQAWSNWEWYNRRFGENWR